MIPDKPSIEDFIENPEKYIWGSCNLGDLPENKEKSLRTVTEDRSKCAGDPDFGEVQSSMGLKGRTGRPLI